MCRVPSDCSGVSVESDGRTEIQPCRAAAQACVGLGMVGRRASVWRAG